MSVWRSVPMGFALLVVAMFVVACGGAPDGSPPSDGADSAAPPVAAASSTQVSPSSFTVSTGEGTKFSSLDHPGEVLVLYFSFPGWPTCGLEAPALGRIQQEFGGRGLAVVAINTAPFASMEEWKKFWQSKDAADVTWATDPQGELVQQFRVYSLGTTIILDRQGRIAYRDDGATPYEVLRREVVKIF